MLHYAQTNYSDMCDLMSRTYEDDRGIEAALLSKAVEAGIIDLSLGPFDSAITQMMINAESVISHKNEFSIASAPQSTRYQEHSFPPQATGGEGFASWIELARIAVPEGHIGYLSQIEQVVRDDDGLFIATNARHWGTLDFDSPGLMAMKWFLRLEQFDGTLPERFIFVTNVPSNSDLLPGYPLSDLPEINGLWYPANNAVGKLKIQIPSGHLLRFFVSVDIPAESDIQTWRVSGRLRAYTQSTYDPCAVVNSRRLYF